MMQLVGYYTLRNTKDSKSISRATAEAAVLSAKRDFIDSIHNACLKPLSDRDRDFLKAMSEDKISSRMADIQERMEVTASYAQQYRTRLIESGVILSEQRGRVEFAVPYLGEYLRGEIDNLV
jgi:predicted transcriptional regulator